MTPSARGLLLLWTLPTLAVACQSDGRKSGAAGIEDAYTNLAEFECGCYAEALGGGAEAERQCREQLDGTVEGELFPFDCIDRAVSGNAQAEAAFDCLVSATYDYVDCITGEGCPEVLTCADGTTYSEFDVCDGFQDCEDGADEANGCTSEPFVCADGLELSNFDLCDGFDDCEDAADEAGCPETCDSVFEDANERCGELPLEVEPDIEMCFPSYMCADGTSVDEGAECDGFDDCADGSDEAACATSPSRRGPRPVSMRGQLLRRSG
jgi:hypothetical protein